MDGYKCDEVEDETFGVWDRHFQGVRHPDLLADMKKAGRPVRGLNVRSRKQ